MPVISGLEVEREGEGETLKHQFLTIVGYRE